MTMPLPAAITKPYPVVLFSIIIYTKYMLYSTLFFVLLLLLFGSSQLTSQALTALFSRVIRSHTFSVRFLAVLFLPGVIMHEFAHAIMAKLLFVPVGEMEFMPKIEGDRVRLGSVQIGKTDPFRRTLIGLAPILVGLSVLFVLLFFFLPKEFVLSGESLLQSALLFYAVFVIGNTMFSSRRDIEGSMGFLVAILILLVVLYVAGVRLPESFWQYIRSEAVQQLFYSGSIFLAVPLAINAIVIFFVRVLMGVR
jgi:hypothetical protein